MVTPEIRDALDRVHHGFDLGAGQARHHFVKQQQFRLRRERPRQFELFLFANRQIAAKHIFLVQQADHIQRLLRPQSRILRRYPLV